MKIFVTGGTGFLGKELVRRLQEDGHEVWGLARSLESSNQITHLGAMPVKGSLEDISQWEHALENMNVVVHCAALVSTWGPWRNFESQITQATIDLLAAADRHGVGRFLYISSESVMQNRTELVDIDETFPCPVKPNSFYGQAKLLAEKAILDYTGNMHCVILRPTFIYGPNDNVSTTLHQMVESGKFTWVDRGRHLIERVHVQNVVDSISLALVRGQNKGVYLITDGAPTTVHEIFTEYAKRLGLDLPKKNIPSPVARMAASIVELTWRVLRLPGTPPLNRFEVAFVSMPRRYRIDKARAELGFQPKVPL